MVAAASVAVVAYKRYSRASLIIGLLGLGLSSIGVGAVVSINGRPVGIGVAVGVIVFSAEAATVLAMGRWGPKRPTG